MVTTQEVKEWVTHRINYWEDELDRKNDTFTTADKSKPAQYLQVSIWSWSL